MYKVFLLIAIIVIELCNKNSAFRGKGKDDGIYWGKGGPRKL
jgi:hypothetical protein